VPRQTSTLEVERVALDDWQADPSRWRGERPVVVTGAFADTAAVRTWTPDRLARRYPTQDVEVSHISPEAWGDWSLAVTERMPLPRLVELVGTGSSAQMLQHPIEPFDGLLAEVDPGRMAEPPYRFVNLWIGRGTRTPLHHDWAENVFVQVYGSKRFVLEPPDSPAGRYVHPASSSHVSRVDPLAPDLELFPDYDPGRQRTVDLAAGDALYLPPGWFHDVTAPETSISVNCWFGEYRPRPSTPGA
jgi:hypothetical protein